MPTLIVDRLNVFFAIASTTCNVSALVVGTILDRHGPRVAAIIGSLSLAAGSALMGSAFAIPEFDGYIAGNVLLSLGGTFIFVPSFQVANAFPKWSGTIVAMVTGAFDASVSMKQPGQRSIADISRRPQSSCSFAWPTKPLVAVLGQRNFSLAI